MVKASAHQGAAQRPEPPGQGQSQQEQQHQEDHQHHQTVRLGGGNNTEGK